MNVSIIISTYNSPIWLEKVLWGLEQQTYRNFEVVIADDGSSNETEVVLKKFSQFCFFNIKHVWQEDEGFRKCEIVNKGIILAEEEYIIFLDGDCIPKENFVFEHISQAQPNTFLTGSFIRLPMTISILIDRETIINQECFEWNWLIKNGLQKNRKNSKINMKKFLVPLFNKISPARTNFKGGNASAWKKDLLQINGFDHRMAWGGEDRELGERLKNIGIKGKHVRYSAIIIHLDHSRGYADPVQVAKNKLLRLDVEKKKLQRTPCGIDKIKREDIQTLD